MFIFKLLSKNSGQYPVWTILAVSVVWLIGCAFIGGYCLQYIVFHISSTLGKAVILAYPSIMSLIGGLFFARYLIPSAIITWILVAAGLLV